MSETRGRVIELRGDIPCSGCGYNLRGLAPQGRCPECGREVSVSLAEHVVPEAAVASLDPRWRRQMIEVIVLALLGLAAAVASVFDWPRRWQWGRTGPDVPIALVCTWWALQWYSSLKLTRTEPETRLKRWDGIVVWALRVSATIYLVLPALRVARQTVFMSVYWPVLITCAEYCAPIAALGYFFRMRRVCLRLSSPTLAAHAGLVALLMALSVMSWETQSLRWQWYQQFLLVLPSFQFGPMATIAELVHGTVRSRGWEVLRAVTSLPVPLAAMTITVMLLVKLVRARQVMRAPAASVERNPASSPP